MDRGAWQVTFHGVAKSQTQLSLFHSLTVTGGREICICFLGGCNEGH